MPREPAIVGISLIVVAALAGCVVLRGEGEDAHGKPEIICREVSLRIDDEVLPTGANASNIIHLTGRLREDDERSGWAEVQSISAFHNASRGRSRAEFAGLSSESCPRAASAGDVRAVLLQSDTRLAFVYAFAESGFPERDPESAAHVARNAWIYR